jgi:hypothetical protein
VQVTPNSVSIPMIRRCTQSSVLVTRARRRATPPSDRGGFAAYYERTGTFARVPFGRLDA